MTDNEIIKALECCTKLRYDIQQPPVCVNCPYYNLDDCTFELKNNTLALINRQKAEIERLKTKRDKEHDYCNHYARMCAKAKADAIREFAERLKEKYPYEWGCASFVAIRQRIDDLVKEKAGGNDDL